MEWFNVFMKRFGIALLVTLTLASSVGVAVASPKAGGFCTKLNSLTHIQGKTYVCSSLGKKKIWKAQSASPASSSTNSSNGQTPSTSPTASSTVPDPALTSKTLMSDVSACKLNSTLKGGNLGVTRDPQDIPTLGARRGVVIFVDFNDVKGDPSLFDEWKLNQIPVMEKTYATMSYGKLTYTIDLIPQIFHISKDSWSYLLNTPHDEPANPKASPYTLVFDAMTAADSTVDFSKYEYVNVVTPTTPNILYEGATGVSGTFDGKEITRATFSTEREYINQKQKANWLVHETGHLMGLIHNYDVADSNGAFKAEDFQLPAWDAMTYPLTVAPDFFGWTKYILGWITDDQVDCLSAPPTSNTYHFLSPIGVSSSKTKIVVLKLDANNLLVVESRRNSTLDRISATQEGVIVYQVNMQTPSGQGAVKLLFNKPNVGTFPSDVLKFGPAATFRAAFGNLSPGEVLKTQGIAITYVKRSTDGDFISVSRS